MPQGRPLYEESASKMPLPGSVRSWRNARDDLTNLAIGDAGAGAEQPPGRSEVWDGSISNTRMRSTMWVTLPNRCRHALVGLVGLVAS
jgi:hypothetical protein